MEYKVKFGSSVALATFQMLKATILGRVTNSCKIDKKDAEWNVRTEELGKGLEENEKQRVDGTMVYFFFSPYFKEWGLIRG